MATSMFYDYLDVLAERFLRGEISSEEVHKHSMILLENELAHPELFGKWLESHYDSIVENLMNSEEERSKEEWMRAIEMSNEEAELFRKYGWDFTANLIENQIRNAKEYVEGRYGL